MRHLVRSIFLDSLTGVYEEDQCEYDHVDEDKGPYSFTSGWELRAPSPVAGSLVGGAVVHGFPRSGRVGVAGEDRRLTASGFGQAEVWSLEDIPWLRTSELRGPPLDYLSLDTPTNIRR
jgi:hypothetical protein